MPDALEQAISKNEENSNQITLVTSCSGKPSYEIEHTEAGLLFSASIEDIDAMGAWLGENGVSLVGYGEHDSESFTCKKFMFVTGGILFY